MSPCVYFPCLTESRRNPCPHSRPVPPRARATLPHPLPRSCALSPVPAPLPHSRPVPPRTLSTLSPLPSYSLGYMLPRTSPATLSLSRSFRALPRFPASSPTHPHNPPRPLPRFPGSPPLHPLAPSSLFPRLYGPLTSSPATLTSSPATLTSSPASSAPFPAFPHLPTFPHAPPRLLAPSPAFPAPRTPASHPSRPFLPIPQAIHPPRLSAPLTPSPPPLQTNRSRAIPAPPRRNEDLPGPSSPFTPFTPFPLHPSARLMPPSFLPPAADSSRASRRSPSSSSL